MALGLALAGPVRADLASDCETRFREVSEYRLLAALPDYKELAETGRATAALEAALSGWSTDLMVKIVLGMEQEYLAGHCPAKPGLEAALLTLKRAYLAKLGIASAKLAATDLDGLFRSFLVLKDDATALKKKITAKGMPKAPAKLPKAVYGSASVWKGVAIVGGSVKARVALEAAVGGICAGREPCPFWNGASIYKCIVSPEPGLAAYLPEMAVLVLSEALLLDRNVLHDIVLLHELAHVAERGAWMRARRDWRKEFQAFSGWEEGKDGKLAANAEALKVTRDDALTKLSKTSAFSILPDPIVAGLPTFDGFVLAKAYRETIARGDVSEDIADHIAALFFAPARFCHDGKAIAPRKWKWALEAAYEGKPPAGVAKMKLGCVPSGT